MVGYLPHCTFNLNPRAASIDTPLHAYVPHAHVDHMHPDAIIAIAAAKNSQRADAGDLRRRDRLAAVEAAGLRARPVAGEVLPRRIPKARGVVLESHGLFTWGDTRKECYETTHRASSTRRSTGSRARPPARPVFGGAAVAAAAAERAPRHRGAADAGDPRPDLGKASRKVGHFDDQPAVLEFVGSQRSASRWRRSAPPAPTISCAPRSGRWWSSSIRPSPTSTRCSPGLPADIEAYRAGYAGLLRALQARRQPADARPQRGRLSGARRRHDHLRQDKATARISGEFYVNAINVMRGASTVSDLCRPARAGSLRHRILAARGGEAAAHAEAEDRWPAGSPWSPAAPAASAARRPTRLLARRRLRGAGRHRRGSARRGDSRASAKRYGERCRPRRR